VMHGMPSDSATSKEETNAFMRGLLMHGAMGTMLGGVSTMVGEPQNLLIAHSAGWQFREFFVRMAHVSLPVFATGTAVCLALELFRVKAFGYGHRLPEEAQSYLAKQSSAMQVHDGKHRLILIVMGFSCVALVVALGMQLAAVGLVGLGLLIVVPSFTGQAREHALGESFKDVMPFAALLGVFFAIVAMIDSTGMFRGITNAVLKTTGQGQEFAFFTASGILSAVSDNVFVASIYINEAMAALHNGLIDKVQFDKLAIAINAGTNIFSIATPNGQAAFLFLLTSAVAKRTGLSYLKMLTMAVPYTLVLVSVAYLCMGLGR